MFNRVHLLTTQVYVFYNFIPRGIGITDGALAGLLTTQGIDISTALILSVMIRVLTLWFSVCVGFIALKFTGGLSFKQNS